MCFAYIEGFHHHTGVEFRFTLVVLEVLQFCNFKVSLSETHIQLGNGLLKFK